MKILFVIALLMLSFTIQARVVCSPGKNGKAEIVVNDYSVTEFNNEEGSLVHIGMVGDVANLQLTTNSGIKAQAFGQISKNSLVQLVVNDEKISCSIR